MNRMAQVIRIENSMLRHRSKFLTVAAVVSPTSQDCPCVTMPLLNLSNRVLRHRPCVPVLVNSLLLFRRSWTTTSNNRRGQEGCEMFLDTDWTRSWTATTMRLTKRLVKVVMDSIKAHQSWTCSSKNCVEVRPIIIHQTSNIVDDFRCFSDVLLKETERVWIGDHHGRSIVTDNSTKC